MLPGRGGRIDERVPFVDLRPQHRDAMPALAAAFERVTRGSAFVLGEELERFERDFARFCGAEHCVGVSSGTAALSIALRAGGIGPGDEVVVPAHTYVATAFAVALAGATPVFADVEEATGLLDANSLRAAIGERAAAVIPVHLYGRPCAMEEVVEAAARHGLLVLEDAAQAHGARLSGRRVGSFGDAAAFSFYPSKNLGALGDGGAIVTGDAELAERARALRNLGQAEKGVHLAVAGNDRLDGLQAAFLGEKLPRLDGWNERRRGHASLYRRLLGDAVATPPEDDRRESVHHLFPVRLADRDRVAARLRERGIETGVHYSPTAAWQPPFDRSPGDFPAADRWQREELSLPMFPELEERQVERVAAELGELPGGGP